MSGLTVAFAATFFVIGGVLLAVGILTRLRNQAPNDKSSYQRGKTKTSSSGAWVFVDGGIFCILIAFFALYVGGA